VCMWVVADARHRPVMLTLPDWTGDLSRRTVQVLGAHTTLEHECRQLARTLPVVALRRFPSLRHHQASLERYGSMHAHVDHVRAHSLTLSW
jgi:hypothetical protein